MGYLTDHRGDLRHDPATLLPTASSIICIGKLYKTRARGPEGISCYAWSRDYHETVRDGLRRLTERLVSNYGAFEYRICVDTAPLLERSFAQAAGLGWIGKNTCLINQKQGSWFFLGELLVSIPLAPDAPPPNRCGSCTRCVDACPTAALVEDGQGSWMLDATRCISYLTIENRGAIPPNLAQQVGQHIFGCDICQDVCPWNRRAPLTEDPNFEPDPVPGSLDEFARLDASQFRALFGKSPVWRARYRGFLRNVAIALGNSDSISALEPLRQLSSHPDDLVRQAAIQALQTFEEKCDCSLPLT